LFSVGEAFFGKKGETFSTEESAEQERTFTYCADAKLQEK
jgi:hypothetical protein